MITVVIQNISETLWNRKKAKEIVPGKPVPKEIRKKFFKVMDEIVSSTTLIMSKNHGGPCR